MTLDQIVVDADYPECTRLHSCSGLDELHQITDVKGNISVTCVYIHGCYRVSPVMPRLQESGPFQGSYGQPRETTQHLLGPI